jgi:hypothetical protein
MSLQGAQTEIISDVNALKRKRTESIKHTEKRQRKENWSLDDDLDLLKLIHKHRFAWDQILHDFKKFQHRRPK